MDLNSYYIKMREQQATIPDEYPVVVSHATGDGGVKGRMTEVTKRIAARLIVEGMARLADAIEANQFHNLKKEAKAAVENAAKGMALEATQIAMSKLLQAAAPLSTPSPTPAPAVAEEAPKE
jgi:hypothetical protein